MIKRIKLLNKYNIDINTGKDTMDVVRIDLPENQYLIPKEDLEQLKLFKTKLEYRKAVFLTIQRNTGEVKDVTKMYSEDIKKSKKEIILNIPVIDNYISEIEKTNLMNEIKNVKKETKTETYNILNKNHANHNVARQSSNVVTKTMEKQPTYVYNEVEVAKQQSIDNSFNKLMKFAYTLLIIIALFIGFKTFPTLANQAGSVVAYIISGVIGLIITAGVIVVLKPLVKFIAYAMLGFGFLVGAIYLCVLLLNFYNNRIF